MKKATGKKIMADLQAVADNEGKDELLRNLEIAVQEYVEDRQATGSSEPFTNFILLLSDIAGVDARVFSATVRRLLHILIIEEMGIDPAAYIAEYEQKQSGKKLN